MPCRTAPSQWTSRSTACSRLSVTAPAASRRAASHRCTLLTPRRQARSKPSLPCGANPRRKSERQQLQGSRSAYLGDEVFISLVDGLHGPYREDIRQLAVSAWVTNRDLPTLLPLAGRGQHGLEVGCARPRQRCRGVARTDASDNAPPGWRPGLAPGEPARAEPTSPSLATPVPKSLRHCAPRWACTVRPKTRPGRGRSAVCARWSLSALCAGCPSTGRSLSAPAWH
jgi:hypothetical protein